MPTVCASVPMQRADDDQPAAQRALDRGVDLLGRQQRVVALDDLDRVGVDEVVDPAVDDEEREVRAHRLGVHDQRRVHAHLVGELQRGALGDAWSAGSGSVKLSLHHAVAGGVAVRPDDASRRPHLAPPGARWPGCSTPPDFLATPSRPRPRVGGPLHQAERAVGDRVEQPVRVVDDPLEQVDRLPQHLAGPAWR